MGERVGRATAPYCRWCGREDIDAHKQWCPRAPDEPLPDDPTPDHTRTGIAEDEYHNAMIGERP